MQGVGLIGELPIMQKRQNSVRAKAGQVPPKVRRKVNNTASRKRKAGTPGLLYHAAPAGYQLAANTPHVEYDERDRITKKQGTNSYAAARDKILDDDLEQLVKAGLVTVSES